MRSLRTLLLVASLSCLSMAANAHPLPKTAIPKPNAVLTGSPTEIRIGFSETLVAVFCGLELDDANGKGVETGAATVDPNDGKMLIVPIEAKLGAGTYTVKWHAVGADTHHVSGHYSFQVKA